MGYFPRIATLCLRHSLPNQMLAQIRLHKLSTVDDKCCAVGVIRNAVWGESIDLRRTDFGPEAARHQKIKLINLCKQSIFILSFIR